MSHLDILLPFGLPPAEMAAHLLRELHAPALATLVARTRSRAAAARHETFDDFRRALPHESWLARKFGVECADSNTSPPVAAALMQAMGLDSEAGTWFVAHPVHIHVARDHLVLTNPRQLPLTDEESRTLFGIAQPLFEEYGKKLVFGNAATWFIRADEWGSLHTATVDAASGHNIDIWMPRGAGERDWRKLQNEVQMHWFNHPLNEEREATGRKAVNSLWLWGAASANVLPASGTYHSAFNLVGWMSAFTHSVSRHDAAGSADKILSGASAATLLVLPDLIEPALANDWGRWLENMRDIETTWFAPILDQLKAGKVDTVSMILSHDTRLSTFTATRTSLRKFWVKPSLAVLCP